MLKTLIQLLLEIETSLSEIPRQIIIFNPNKFARKKNTFLPHFDVT